MTGTWQPNWQHNPQPRGRQSWQPNWAPNWQQNGQQGPQRGMAPGDEWASPIRSERQVTFFEYLVTRPHVRANAVLVGVTASGDHQVWSATKQPRHSELFLTGIRLLYEVDMGLHQIGLEAKLPSENEAFEFHADIEVQWRVADATQVVRDHVTDVREALRPVLLSLLRPITRRYATADAAGAEDALNAALAQAGTQSGGLGHELGLWTRAFVRLRLDEATRQEGRMTTSMSLYRAIMEGGEYTQAAAQIARDPSQLGEVAAMVRREEGEVRDRVLDFVRHLAESGLIERWEIDERTKAALQWVRDSTDLAVTGIPGQQELEAGPRRPRRAARNSAEDDTSPDPPPAGASAPQ
jgi:hypothetical protein